MKRLMCTCEFSKKIYKNQGIKKPDQGCRSGINLVGNHFFARMHSGNYLNCQK